MVLNEARIKRFPPQFNISTLHLNPQLPLQPLVCLMPFFWSLWMPQIKRIFSAVILSVYLHSWHILTVFLTFCGYVQCFHVASIVRGLKKPRNATLGEKSGRLNGWCPGPPPAAIFWEVPHPGLPGRWNCLNIVNCRCLFLVKYFPGVLPHGTTSIGILNC